MISKLQRKMRFPRKCSYHLFATSYKMPHNKYNRNDVAIETGFRCVCGQTFNYNSLGERNMKIRMHKKFCSSCPDDMAMPVMNVRIVR